IAHRPAVGEHEVDALGTVERAAPADGHDRVDAAGGRLLAARLPHARIRVGVEAVEEEGCDPGGTEKRGGALDMSRRDDAWIGDDERSRAGQVAREIAELRQ